MANRNANPMPKPIPDFPTPWDSLPQYITQAQDTLLTHQDWTRSYLVYQKMSGYWAAGTLSRPYPTEAEARAEFEVLDASDGVSLQPVRCVPQGSSFYLVFNEILVDFPTWIRKFSARPPPDAASGGQQVLAVFRAIVRGVRRQFVNGQPCFGDLFRSVGITESNQVVFTRAPDAGNNFEPNIVDLGRIARHLCNCMTHIVGSRPGTTDHTTNILNHFCNFVNSYRSRTRDRNDDVWTVFAVNHPTSMSEGGLLTFFDNLGLLADQANAFTEILWRDSAFREHLRSSSNLRNWETMVFNSRTLANIFEYDGATDTVIPGFTRYGFYQLPSFCHNASKHYWQHCVKYTNEPQLSRREAVQLMCEVITGLAHGLFMGYLKAVLNLYTRQGFTPRDILDVET